MIDIARRYGALIKEVESVKMEIRRLDGWMFLVSFPFILFNIPCLAEISF
jgi:hypothetical protein